MADRPIIFSGPMVRALLDGRKTQTRRLVTSPLRLCMIGDRLYVREAWLVERFEPCLPHERDWQSLSGPTIRFLADDVEIANKHGDRSTGRGIYHGPVEKGRPSIHMPRWASRLTLHVEDVRVERLQSISEADAIAEGMRWRPALEAWTASDSDSWPTFTDPRRSFAGLWRHLHGPESWDANPFVVALTFRVEHGNIDNLVAGRAGGER